MQGAESPAKFLFAKPIYKVARDAATHVVATVFSENIGGKRHGSLRWVHTAQKGCCKRLKFLGRKFWRPLGDLNPCYRRERPAS